MDIFEEVKKIWEGFAGDDFFEHTWKERQEEVARLDYYKVVGEASARFGEHYRQQCCRTVKLIRKRMIEALTSSNPYVREMAKLIGEQQNEAERMSTAGQ